MPGRRPKQQGSFASHFDELVKHFPAESLREPPHNASSATSLKEKRDIHALLFEQAWRVDH